LKDNGLLASRLSGFVGYDAGAIIAHNDDRFERGQMHAATLGLRLANRHIQAELSASAPIVSPAYLNHKPVEVSASVRLAY
jgi:hemolysin activation/secretion protein